MTRRLVSFALRLIGAALTSAIFVGLLWLTLDQGCKQQIIACVDVTWEIILWAFAVGTLGFFFYQPGRTTLSRVKEEQWRKFGLGNRYFSHRNWPGS